MSNQETRFGFSKFAETWNGRIAMLGIVIGIATEYLTGQGILSQLGLMQFEGRFKIIAVDNTNVTAEYKDGIFSLTLPKAEQEKNRIVKVQIS